MADEQTPQSDLIDDAIRQAERQLEEKLEALRMSALGEPTPSDAAPNDDVAVLRPTGGARASAGVDEPADDAGHDDDPRSGSGAMSWQESGGDDVTFTPVDSGSVTLSGDELYVPDPEPEAPSFDEVPHELVSHEPPADQAEPLHGRLTSSVTDLTPVWEDLGGGTSERATPAAEPNQPELPAQPMAAYEPGHDEPDWERPEPVHTSWTSSAPTSAQPPRPSVQSPAQPLTVTSMPSEDELQFWAQTRTALRTLHQLTTGIPGQVSGDVTGEVQRIVQSELSSTDEALRTIHQQLQQLPQAFHEDAASLDESLRVIHQQLQQLPRIPDRIEQVLDNGLVAPTTGIRQLRDELPVQVDRAARELRAGLREDLDQSAGLVHGAVQKDVAQLEQSIATNVTRMAHGTVDAVTKVERDVESLGEGVVRLERGMQGEFDRVESQLRAAIERVDSTLREELVEPSETLRKLDEELPARFGRIERTLLEQVQSTQRELSTVLMGLVEANRASLDRIASLASTFDEERARRTEDVEVVVDTVTTGWEGLAGAVKALFEQGEENARRIAGIEQRLTQIRDLEGAVEGTMTELRGHIRDLQPAPIVVTVAHPEAEVRNTARPGWLPETGSSDT